MRRFFLSLQAILVAGAAAQNIPPRDVLGWLNERGNVPEAKNPTVTPRPTQHDRDRHGSAAQFSCGSLAYGLTPEDCEYMASIGVHGQGENAMELGANGTGIWIGIDGPNTFTFINAADVPMILIMWYRGPGDDQASFVNVRAPTISYSLPIRNSAVGISALNGVPGGWSMLYNRSTPLTQYGQVDNTFGEFSTGDWATIDVSRLVKMTGNPMIVAVSGGCVADMERCVYACDTGTDSCGAAGTYNLLGCEGKNAVQAIDPDGNPTGGCQGWSNGGHLDIFMM
ncbi:hypothetical protein QBC34DRAFT_149368 [Podospora aff. communis PSN243]|uniref:Uncharacterized protein n=1 Tax=Podospora aff. communis PSN243 TaxID=3040156 RepID=A0AAV9GGW0_9PEZI|nr:hypothetical protein QBC34DRAFT_149368 [Podospora aff. communis PSN243]